MATLAADDVPCGRVKIVLLTFEEWGEIYQVVPVFTGDARPCTFAIVDGLWAYNNSDFTIDSVTGILTLLAPIGEVRNKYCRVRITDTLTSEYVDKVIKAASAMAAAGTIDGVPYDTALPNVI